MAEPYWRITGIEYGTEKMKDGEYIPTAIVSWVGTGKVPASGTVVVPAEEVRDPVKFARTIGDEIKMYLAAHEHVTAQQG